MSTTKNSLSTIKNLKTHDGPKKRPPRKTKKKFVHGKDDSVFLYIPRTEIALKSLMAKVEKLEERSISWITRKLWVNYLRSMYPDIHEEYTRSVKSPLA